MLSALRRNSVSGLTRSLFTSHAFNHRSGRLFSSVLIGNSRDTDDSCVSFHTSDVGHMAEGSVMCTANQSVVHATVCSDRKLDATDDFLPLTVDYRSRSHAFGAIPSNVKRRERHGTDEEILVSRVIDRSIRPLFPKGYVNDVQITVTAQAVDGVADPVVMGVNAASCALMFSKQPWDGPVGCVRIGMVGGELVVSPTQVQLEDSSLDLLYAGTKDRVLMVEASACEVPESDVARALDLAHESIQPLINAQLECLAARSEDKEGIQSPDINELEFSRPRDMTVWSRGDLRVPMLQVPEDMQAFAREIGLEAATNAFSMSLPRSQRSQAEGKARHIMLEAMAKHEEYATFSPVCRAMAAEAVMSEAFRDIVHLQKRRVDGRGLTDIRNITANHSVLPTVHGSAFFQRGDTHVLGVTTLGSRKDARVLPRINGPGEKVDYFYLHYDFPPYCTGETGNATAVNRRMVGHGNLAEKALRPVMPGQSEFPYTVRVFAECTSSSGSSSMASACAASLSMMDAGVPLKAAVAGISVGLVTPACLEPHSPGDNYTLLTDILGLEDHYGDMDCKVAGSRSGVTAIQLDVKLPRGIPIQVLKEALYRAKDGRSSILDVMDGSIKTPRASVNQNAPMAAEIKYDPERKRHLIGPGGEMIKYIENTYDCSIDVSVEGIAYIHGKSHAGVAEAELLVRDLVVEAQEGDIHLAEVLDIKDYGVRVRLTRAQEALLHMSEFTTNEALLKKPMSELVAVGQRLRVKVIGVDRAAGTIKVSRKQLLDSSVQDELSPEPPVEGDKPIGTVPTFPMTPPRTFSVDFFQHSVTTKEENEVAAKKNSNTMDPEIKLSRFRHGPRRTDSSRSKSSEKIHTPKDPFPKSGVEFLNKRYSSPEELEELGVGRLMWELRDLGVQTGKSDVKALAKKLWKVISRRGTIKPSRSAETRGTAGKPRKSPKKNNQNVAFTSEEDSTPSVISSDNDNVDLRPGNESRSQYPADTISSSSSENTHTKEE